MRENAIMTKLEQELAATGHGHVVPRFDGSRTRCGGPNMCTVCMWERWRYHAVGGLTIGAMLSTTGISPQPQPTMSFNDFVLTRADLEVMQYGGGKWRSYITAHCEGRGDTRESALRDTYHKWIEIGCP